ncbi:MAG: hypothetical protein QOG10_1773 [Kribbellaceae bacterium]|jgi:hypothetical protein|nr:hypothetical protein [Kribbellaceae bacterium]
MMPSRRLRCAIHQPNLFPRLSTLAKLFAADIWIALDDVQFSRRDYQHRARLGPRDDLAAHQWMSLPVRLPRGRNTLINDVQILEPERSRRRLLRMTRQHHGRGPHWASVGEGINLVAEAMTRTDSLADIAIASTHALLDLLSWPGTVIRSSDVTAATERSARLADLTHAVGATQYLCGTGGARYLRPTAFSERNLDVLYFSVPTGGNEYVWAGARRISSIAPLSDAGGSAVRRTLMDEISLRDQLAPTTL